MGTDPEKTEENGKKPFLFDASLRLDWIVLIAAASFSLLATLLVCASCIPAAAP